MQMWSFLITEWTDDLSKSGVDWLFFPFYGFFFFPSMNSNTFVSVFSLEYISLLKNTQMKLKYVKVSERFAKGLVF